MHSGQLSSPPTRSGHTPEIDWRPLLDAIGTREFKLALRRFLSQLVGPEGSAALFHEASGELITACHCADACSCQEVVNGTPHWIHFADGPWRASIAVSSAERLRWEESSELSQRLLGAGGALAAILRKHIDASRHEKADAEPLSNLEAIEKCLTDCTALPTRELEVCARILFGLSSVDVAIDLHLSEATVKTYRKRFYQRLCIGSERELLVWYLRTWIGWRKQAIRPG